MKTISTVFIVLILLISCSNESRDCKDCNAAIDHMAEKLSNFSCNPNFMETAWQRIKDDCGAMGDTYVGYMAENCNLGEDFDLNCASKLYLRNPILGFDTRGVPDSLNIIVKTDETSVSFGIKRTDYIEETLSTSIYDGDLVEITVQNALTDEVLAQASVRFTFERNYLWAIVRSTVISYSLSEGYSLNFEDW